MSLQKISNSKNAKYAGVVTSVLLAGTVLWEGIRYDPYYDIVKVLTVCAGHTGNDIVKRRYTPAECDALTKKDLVKHQEPVLRCITQPMKQNEVDAFTLFALNLGGTNFCKANFVKLFNAGKTQEACRAMAYGMREGREVPVWSNAGGKYVQGLHNRRKFEMNWCLGNYPMKINLEELKK